MTKVNQNFTAWSGDDITPRYTVQGAAASIGKDLTGASILWILVDQSSGASLIRKTTDTAGHFTVSGCTFDVNIAASDTSGLAGDYWSEAQVRDSASIIQTVAVGWVTINRDLAS